MGTGDAMRGRLPRGRTLTPILPTIAATLLVAACTAAATPAPTAPPTGAIATPVVATPAPASLGPAASVAPSPSPTGTTSTDFGAIRDAVPPSFPLPPDLQPADLPDGAFSGTYSTPTASGAVATAIAAGLQAEGWTAVTTSGPTEAGEVTIDATGTAAGCRSRVTVGPLGGLTMVKVLYGATCPAE
jgi:hypothetical protein